MDYLELTVSLQPREPFADLFIDALGDVGFESFVENEAGFCAYIQQEMYSDGLEKTAWAWTMDGVEVTSSLKVIPRKNWNDEWEKNFEPILVDDAVYIYAPFHPEKPEFEHQILIEPKMSFGTGHHQTTHLMVQFMLEQNFAEKRVLDMGCGTGILAILAAQKGASKVVAIDIDDWSVENSIENAQRNNIEMETRLGGAEVLKAETFNVILANINLNILLADIAAYANVLANGGHIFFSGFYEHDLDQLRAEAAKNNLNFVSHKQRDNWASAHFVKEN